MIVENGEWIMTSLEYDDPNCIHSPKELIEYINKVGFLPLFGNDIPGFSVEEHTWYMGWWSGNAEDEEIKKEKNTACLYPYCFRRRWCGDISIYHQPIKKSLKCREKESENIC